MPLPAPMSIYFELFMIEFDRSNWAMDYVGILYGVFWKQQIDGSLQEKRNSIANALELRFSCTNPWRYLGNQQMIQSYCAYISSAKIWNSDL